MDRPWLAGWLLPTVLLVLVYLGRLTGVIDPATEVTPFPPLLNGLLVHPAF